MGRLAFHHPGYIVTAIAAEDLSFPGTAIVCLEGVIPGCSEDLKPYLRTVVEALQAALKGLNALQLLVYLIQPGLLSGSRYIGIQVDHAMEHITGPMHSVE